MVNDDTGTDGIVVNTPSGRVVYMGDTPCDMCDRTMDGVLVPESGDAPDKHGEGVPLCEEHYKSGNHYDSDTEWKWHSADN